MNALADADLLWCKLAGLLARAMTKVPNAHRPDGQVSLYTLSMSYKMDLTSSAGSASYMDACRNMDDQLSCTVHPQCPSACP